MIVCVNCAKEMQCVKTGVGVDFGGGHIYAGDRFRCTRCGVEIVQCNNCPHHDPEHKMHDEFIEARVTA